MFNIYYLELIYIIGIILNKSSSSRSICDQRYVFFKVVNKTQLSPRFFFNCTASTFELNVQTKFHFVQAHMSFSVTSQIVFCTSTVNFQQFIFDINKAYTTPFLPIAKNVSILTSFPLSKRVSQD